MKFGINSLAWQSPVTEIDRLLRLAKKYGCDIFELALEDFSTLDPDAINKAVEDTGVLIKTVTGIHNEVRDISADEADFRDSGIRYAKDMVDFAAAIGAEVIAGPIYSAVGKARQQTPDEVGLKWKYGVENMKIIADYGAKKGIKFAIETLNRFETDFINTVEQGVDYIHRIGYGNVGFLLDSFHMGIEENNVPAAIRLAGTECRIYDFHTSANNRGTPGKDNTDWASIRDAIRDVGYDDYCIIESFTPDCVEIAKAASVWRPFSESPEAIARDGVPFLKGLFAE
ncbi:MAG: sugar phosphate isomerase/epimerase [Clostridiales Family XIII bacterium]|jgi:D-psicose/D-tagatose/L-ribulose 3-epimerase|nr:sugar phosphate isomerase/epimerase [Clostridiales Family XIII bacterium]